MPKPVRSTQLIFGVLLTMISSMGCASMQSSQDPLKERLESKLGKNYQVKYNNSKTYALYQQTRTNDHLNRTFKYIVIKVSDHKIVGEGTFRNGYAKWQDDKSIEVGSSEPGSETLKKNIIIVEKQTL